MKSAMGRKPPGPRAATGQNRTSGFPSGGLSLAKSRSDFSLNELFALSPIPEQCRCYKI